MLWRYSFSLQGRCQVLDNEPEDKIVVFCLWKPYVPVESYVLVVHACVCVCVLSYFNHVQLFVTLWTVARQAPLFMGFFRQEYWSRLPFPPPGIP